MEIPERADCAPSARWRQQGTVHRDRVCGAAGRADQRLRPRRHCGRAGAVAELLSAADWSRFTVASAGCRSSAVLLAGVYLAQDGRLISRCGRDEGSKGDRDAARHTAYGDRRRTYRRDRVPARPRAPSWPWCWVTPPVTGSWDPWPKRGWPSTPREAAACGRLPLAAGPTVTSGPGMESEP